MPAAVYVGMLPETFAAHYVFALGQLDRAGFGLQRKLVSTFVPTATFEAVRPGIEIVLNLGIFNLRQGLLFGRLLGLRTFLTLGGGIL